LTKADIDTFIPLVCLYLIPVQQPSQISPYKAVW